MLNWQYSTKSILDKLYKNKIRLTKAKGQNFLIDKNVLNKIINKIELDNDIDTIVEIGPGIGCLTNFLMKFNKKLVLIEIDKKLYNILLDNYSEYKNLKIYNEDILKIKFEQILSKKKRAIVVSNIPYNLTSKIIQKCILNSEYFKDLYFLIQSDVANRIVSDYGSKNFGSLSAFLQYYTNPKLLFSVSKNVFFPKPKITSSYIKLSMNNIKDKKDTIYAFEMYLKRIFSYRRKNIINILTNYLLKGVKNKENVLDNIIEELKLTTKLRPENISSDNLYRIFKRLKNLVY